MSRLTVAVTALLLASLAPAALADPAADLDALIADFETHEQHRDPISAGRDGDLEALAVWPDARPEAVAERLAATREFRDRLRNIDADDLDDDRQVSHSVLAYLLDSRLMAGRFDSQRIPFTNDSGFFTTPLHLANATRPRTVAEAEAWISRLQQIPDYFDAHRSWMELGMQSGFVQPEPIVRGVIEQLRGIAAGDADDSELLAPIGRLPAAIPEDERQRLNLAAREAVASDALPAYRSLLAFFEEEYLDIPRSSLGISELPDGRDYYRALVQQHTTLQITPEELHERGLAEVRRIRAEMDAVVEATGFDGDFAAFLDYLRSDPRFYAETPEELLREAAYLAKLADDAMPSFFRRLPRLPYGVRPVPASLAPHYTTARYWPGNIEAGEAGGYMVNTYALDQRPLYELPALTLHEAVPGHHHQIALAQEIEDVPQFRRRAGITAFVEGWGLYAEYLGQEMGLYRTPYEDFGRLTYEMWRACRLVVDTGLHWYGWSREEAEACLLENSALAPHNVRTEVSRYIAWPGQALAYKTGELLIRALRREAEEELGARFDLRDFHDHLLSAGAMPLAALERRMRAWIETANEDDG